MVLYLILHGTLLLAHSVEVGLEINFTKTIAMTNSLKRPITVNNKQLLYVENYICLGKRICFHRENYKLEIDRRIQGTWKKY